MCTRVSLEEEDGQHEVGEERREPNDFARGVQPLPYDAVDDDPSEE